MADETEVDAPAEEQTDAVLAAIALVVAEAVASQGGNADDDSPLTVAWLPLVQTSAELVLVQYLLQTTGAFVKAVGGLTALPGPRVREIVREAAEGATSRAVEVLEANVPELKALPPVERTAQTRTIAGEVARAMVVGAREEARYNTAHEIGAVYKVWRTRRDNRVRTTHGGLEGNKVPLSSKFVTHDLNEIRFPGDPLAPLSETAGCRCRLSYLVPKKENS